VALPSPFLPNLLLQVARMKVTKGLVLQGEAIHLSHITIPAVENEQCRNMANDKGPENTSPEMTMDDTLAETRASLQELVKLVKTLDMCNLLLLLLLLLLVLLRILV
jgi:hypothetical protein